LSEFYKKNLSSLLMISKQLFSFILLFASVTNGQFLTLPILQTTPSTDCEILRETWFLLNGDPASAPDSSLCCQNTMDITCNSDFATVTSVYWSNKQLSGPLPPILFQGLLSIRVLGLGGNFLNGPIPAGFGNWTLLQSLELGVNQFKGSIPASFNNLQSLITM
jgi:hypothetical protein